MDTHVCPWWLGYFLASPIRKLVRDPDTILSPFVQEGMTILEIGPGMGFFTLPMARMVGEKGRIIAVDIQEKMLQSLERRARRAGLASRIEARLCPENSLGVDDLSGQVDFALAFAVLHEMPSIKSAFFDMYKALKPGGVILVSEPKGHVTSDEFKTTVSLARECGFAEKSIPVIKRNHSIVMTKTG